MTEQNQKIRLGVFTDAHYSPSELTCNDRFNSLSLQKIREALEAFREQSVDACFCLGDLTDVCETPGEAEKCLDEIAELFHEAQKHYPIYVAPGNHDYASWKRERFFEKLGVPCPPYCVRIKWKDFVFLDANYDEQMRSFDSVDFRWDEAYLSPDGIGFLQAALKDSPDCVVVVHELLDPTLEERHVIRNAEPVRRMLEAGGNVRLVLQGHYHYGGESVLNGIRYKTFEAMCVGRENHCFVIEL